MARILLYGLGDLGEKSAYLLAALLDPRHELVIAGRHEAAVDEVAAMARMVGQARPAALPIARSVFGLEPEVLRRALVAIRPDVLVFMATLYSWWRTEALSDAVRAELREAGFAVWLPCQAALPLSLLPVLRSLDHPPWLLLAPYPDAVAPIVARQGFSRVLGFGNVDEIVMALEVRGSTGGEGPPPRDIRLVAHHSVEAALFAGRPLPPHRLSVGSTPVPALTRPFSWPSGTRSHQYTAASLVRTLSRLLADAPAPIHIPGPHGLVGGYPCRAGAGEIRLNLPEGLSEEEAVHTNEEAARADGIERMDSDGTVHLTDRARVGLRAGLDLDIETWEPAHMEEQAKLLLARVRDISFRKKR